MGENLAYSDVASGIATRLQACDSSGNAGIALKNVVLKGISSGDFGVVTVCGIPGLQYCRITILI